MAILDILKIVAKKLSEGEKLTAAESRIVEEATQQSDLLNSAQKSGRLSKEEAQALTQHSVDRHTVRDVPADSADNFHPANGGDATTTPLGEAPSHNLTVEEVKPDSITLGNRFPADASKLSDAEREYMAGIQPDRPPPGSAPKGVPTAAAAGGALFASNKSQADPFDPSSERDKQMEQMMGDLTAASNRADAWMSDRFAKDTAVYDAGMRVATGGKDENLFQIYHNVLDHMRTTKSTPDTVVTLQQFIQNDTDKQRQAVLKDALANPALSDQQKIDTLHGYLALRRSDPSSREQFATLTASLDESPTVEGARIQDLRNGPSLDAVLNGNKAISEISSGLLARGANDSTLKHLAEFGDAIIPFVDEKGVLALAKELGVSQDLFHNVVLYGSLKRKVYQAFEKLPPDEKVAMTRKLLDAARDHSGLLVDDNKFAQFLALDDILKQGGPTDWNVVRDNIFGAMDAGAVFSILKPILRGSLSLLSRGGESIGMRGVIKATPQDTLNVANPDVGRKTATAAIIDSTDETASALGTTKSDILYSHMFPKEIIGNADLTGAPQLIARDFEEFAAMRQRALDRTENLADSFTADERKGIRLAVWRNVRDVAGLKNHLNLTRAEWNDGAIRIEAMYGPNENHGFATLEDAVKTGDYKFGESDSGATKYFFHNFSTNRVTEVNPRLVNAARKGTLKGIRGKDGEFYLQNTTTTSYNDFLGDVFGPEAAVAGRLQGRSVKYLKDLTSRATSLLRTPEFTANDNAALIERSLLRKVTKLLPNTSKGKQRVFDVIAEGDQQERTFSYTELIRDKGLSPKEARAYYGYRNAMDTLWALQNRDLRKTLVQKGFLNTIVSDIVGKFHGRVLSDADQAVADLSRAGGHSYDDGKAFEVLDLVTGEPRSFTVDSLLAEYDKGTGNLVRKFGRFRSKGKGQFEYGWIPSDARGKSVRIRELDHAPLPYREGHMPRIYRDSYFVERKLKGRLNGRSQGVTEVVGAASDKTGANLVKERLANLDDTEGVEYVVRRDRSKNNPVDRAERDWSVIESRNLAGQRHRGEQLAGELSPELDYTLAETANPWESFVRTTRAVSRHVAYRDAVDALKRRYMSLYGDITGGRFPLSQKELLDSARKLEDQKRAKEAIAHWENIQYLNRSPDNIDKGISDMMFDLAEKLEPKIGRTGAKAIRKTGEIAQPLRRLRSLPFILYLALSPGRQFFVQAGQLAQLTGLEPAYILGGDLLREMTAINLGIMTRGARWGEGTQKAAFKAGAHLMRVDEKEFARIVEAFADRSGLPYNVDQHLLVQGFVDPYKRGSPATSIPGRALGITRAVGRGAFSVFKTVGFDAGEFANVQGTWLVALRRFKKANPGVDWATESNLNKINTAAREMSYGMTQPGRFAYQDGWASLPLQFWQVPHKAVLSVTTSQLYTREEKLRILASNLVLFGGAGFVGVDAIMNYLLTHSDTEIPKPMRDAMRGGLTDMFINGGIDMFLNDTSNPTDLMVSENFSPYAQMLTNLNDVFQNTSLPMWELLAKTPAAGTALSRIFKASQDIAFLFTSPDYHPFTDPEDAKKVMLSLATMPSGMNNYLKYKYALKTGIMVSSSGDPTVAVNRYEAMAKLFGVSTSSEQGFYDVLNEEYDAITSVRDQADMVYDSIKRIETLYSNDPDKIREMETGYHFLNQILDTDEQRVFLEQFNKRASQDRMNGDDSVYMLILKRAISSSGDVGSLQHLRNIILNSEMEPDHKKNLLGYLNKAFNARKAEEGD